MREIEKWLERFENVDKILLTMEANTTIAIRINRRELIELMMILNTCKDLLEEKK